MLTDHKFNQAEWVFMGFKRLAKFLKMFDFIRPYTFFIQSVLMSHEANISHTYKIFSTFQNIYESIIIIMLCTKQKLDAITLQGCFRIQKQDY